MTDKKTTVELVVPQQKDAAVPEMSYANTNPLRNIEAPIQSSDQMQRVLLDTVVGVLEGKISITQANTVAAVSAEYHKSVRQGFDMRLEAAEKLALYGRAEVVVEDRDDAPES